MVAAYIQRVGLLRVMLEILALTIIIGAAFTGERAIYSGWEMFPTLIVPAVTPIVFFVLLLDILMAAVFMAEKPAPERRRFKLIIGVDVALVALMLLAWLPYFISVANP